MTHAGNGLAAHGLAVALGGRTILGPIDLALAAGRLTAVVGPNGAGKSTLLRALAGIVPAAGRVLCGGEDVATLPRRARARRIAHLPQTMPVDSPLAVRDAVALGRLPHGWNGGTLAGADREAVERALAATGLDALSARPLTALSGGERQRVSLARALAVEAPILLADEPIAALDPRHALAVLAILRGLARDGRTVVVVLHDLVAAQRHADAIVLLVDGRVAAWGPPCEVLTPERIAEVYGVATRRLDDGLVLPWDEPGRPVR